MKRNLHSWLGAMAVMGTAVTGCSNEPTEPARAQPAPVPTSLVLVSGDQQTSEPGAELPALLVVRVLDQYGNPVAGAPVRFGVHTGGGRVGPDLVTSGADGQAAARWILGPDLGAVPQTMDAWVALAPSPRVRFVATAQLTRGTLTRFEGDSQASMVGTEVATFPSVEVQTATNSQPVAGVVVHWEVTLGGGTTVAATSATDGDGVARIQWTLGATPGALNQVLRASVPDIGAAPVDFSATAVAPPTEITMVSGDSQVGRAGEPWPAPMVVRARNAAGQPVPSATVHWVIASGGGVLDRMSGQTTGSVRTDTAGNATMWGSAGRLAGSLQTVIATTEGVSGVPVTFAVSVGAGAPTRLERYSGNGQTATTGDSLPQPIAVVTHDMYGNPTPGVLIFWWTWDGGSFSPATSTTDSNGIAWTRWTLGSSPGRQVATASTDDSGWGVETDFSAVAVTGP